MPKITLEAINEILNPLNWKTISEQYINLETQMIFECSEGHLVYNDWGHLRNKIECPVCKQNKFYNQKDIIVNKKKNTERILALDQATHVTGYSIFDGNELVKFGIFTTKTNSEESRFNEVKMWFLSMIENWKPDYIAIEGIQYQQNSGVTTFQTLARLQGILIQTCYELKLPLEICPTNTWRAFCGVKGRSRVDKKKSMQLIIKDKFDISVSDDEADAVGIGTYATHQIQLNKTNNWFGE